MKAESCAAGIVLFNPEVERFAKVISAVLPQVSILYLVDNGSDNLACIEEIAARHQNIRLIQMNENRGIATALNIICARAQRDGFHHVLTLDQDTVIEEGMIQGIAVHASSDVGISCPRVLYEENELFQPEPTENVEYISWAITSGSLTSIAAWEDVGGFDDRMFIDGVDKDYCLRLGQHGWSVVRDNSVVMHHRLGNLRCRKMMGRTVYVTNHPAWRHYYMSRNQVYLYRKGLIKMSEVFSYILKETAKVAIFEWRDASKKLASIALGVRDGLQMNVIRK